MFKHFAVAVAAGALALSGTGALAAARPVVSVGPAALHRPELRRVSAPASSSPGRLEVEATVKLPFFGFPVEAAEGPDGAVFVSCFSQSDVWVVAGDRPAVVAEHAPAATEALAADASSLYVATLSTVYRYDRATGAKVDEWKLPKIKRQSTSDDLVVSLTVAQGTLWVSVVDGNDVDVYRVATTSHGALHLVTRSLGAVVAANGTLYYERLDDRLVRVAPSGAARVGPVLAHHPNGLGGGVQFLDSVAAGEVWVMEPAGQGVDATYGAFDAMSLRAGASFDATVGATMVNTQIGPLMLSGAESDSVQRIAGNGRRTDPLRVASGGVLVGPHPAVVDTNRAGTALEVQRLS